ncbi:hypothetical protein GGH12_003506 [Coemansia sp. RSA 1822]|nr:hypothetical protein LPJ76_001524 [Coemansia sp. RSA 638]KAJ2126197.1 hypothetical protein IW147_000348 [Coemansia sp. RSA 720]KAJ2545044.1 hypothetical protein GGF49_000803 [Coemansia sp. RSA 1853]KAJ2562045.1 hypothetical protein GGH12_003506 [Coemansia sp. RSA 1822]
MDQTPAGDSQLEASLLRKRRGSSSRPFTQPQLPSPDPVPANKTRLTQQRKNIPYLQAQVVHYRPRVSVLDKELTTVSYHGLVNFLLLLLSATLIRLAIENYLKYGILVTIPGAGIALQDWLATLAGVLAVLAALLAAFAIEKSAVPEPGSGISSDQKRLLASAGVGAGEKRTLLLHAANLCLVLVVPSCVTYFAIFQPALGTLVMILACVMFLKLYSLVATNFDLRRAYRLGDSQLNSDPLQFTHMRRGRLEVTAASTSNKDAAKCNSDDAVSDGCAAAGRVARRHSDGIDAEIGCVEDMVRDMIPPTLRTSFSLNARALADFHVAGNDRIDAKADALPRPRLRMRATTASEVLRRVATVAGADSHSAAIDDGSLSDDGAAAEVLAYRSSGRRRAQGETPQGLGRHAIQYAVAYPDNVRLANFGYFWLAPTLCYQPSYPRMTGPVRKSFVAKRLAELAILCVAMCIVIQQYAVPTLVGSVRAIDTRNGFWLSERVLKLSVISAAVWFLGFYAVFHAGLNALAEVLRFADRAFYLDWWNSVDLAAYWREWNLPIHYFCKRHIMMPLVSPPLNLPVGVGVLLTFLVSAVMHELLFGIPTHCLKGYSFVGMMAQIPLIQLTQWLVRWRGPESGLGNAVFWISFCIVGQPLGVVQYYYTWVKNNP